MFYRMTPRDYEREREKRSSVTLLDDQGYLCVPASAIDDEMQKEYWGENNIALLYVYPAGDCDAIDTNNPNMEHLRSALYDFREQGLLPPKCSEVVLPGGEKVEF